MFDFSLAIRAWCLILLSFLVGVVLMFLRLPSGFDWLRPMWLVLILIYWALMMPKYVNVGFAWFVGLGLDIIYGIPIGGQALVLVSMIFIITEFRHKIIALGVWKTSLVIFVLILFYRLLLFLMQYYSGYYFSMWSILNGAIVSTLVWPPLALLLLNYQMKLYN